MERDTTELYQDQPMLTFPDPAGWENWLADEHAGAPGLWRGKAEALIAAGRMRPAGLREVEAARADGRWAAAYEGQGTATVPEDLRRALDQDETAAAFFATLDRGNRYAILYRIHEAKKPETRAARIAKFVTMLRDHQTVHPVPARNRANTAQG